MFIRIGEDTHGEIFQAFVAILIDAQDNDISKQRFNQLGQLLKTHRSIFRIKLRNQPPMKVEPMKVTLERAHIH